MNKKSKESDIYETYSHKPEAGESPSDTWVLPGVSALHPKPND